MHDKIAAAVDDGVLDITMNLDVARGLDARPAFDILGDDEHARMPDVPGFQADAAFYGEDVVDANLGVAHTDAPAAACVECLFVRVETDVFPRMQA